jgi:hypothetical protein
MRSSTILQAVLASLIVLVARIPAGQAQGLFFGMMGEQTPTLYSSTTTRGVTEAQAINKFKAMDLNDDGVISKDEYGAAYSDLYADAGDVSLSDRFRALDGNRDSKITRQEFVANRNVPVTETFSMETPNGAGDDR